MKKKNPRFAGAMLGLVLASTLAAKTFQALPGKSRITYTIVHPLLKVEGVSWNFESRVELGADTLHSTIHTKVPILSFNSGHETRDAKVLEIVDAFQFPFVEFTSDSIQRQSPCYQVFGQLTFHGIRKPLHFLVIPGMAQGVLHVTGEFDLKLSDFQVERPTFMFARTHDDFHVDFDLIPNPL